MKFALKLVGLSLLINFPGFSQLSTKPVALEHNAISFIQNDGQWHENVKYRAPLGAGSVYLEDNTFTYSQLDVEGINNAHDHSGETKNHSHSDLINGHAWQAKFIGANSNPALIGSDKKTEYHNYFIGKDQSKWASKVPLYSQIKYEQLYNGINLEVYSSASHFKYDFIVAPGADAAVIQMQFSGLDGIEIKNGNLVSKTSVGDFIENAPYAYQIIGNQKKTVPCQYVLNGNTVSFSFPEGYNKDIPLVIDPELIGATLSGSTSVTNYGHCATYDNDGHIYGGARAFGDGYPTELGSFQTDFGGSQDIGISKYSPDASSLLYATYLGGSGADLPHSMVVNNDNELYVFGSTQSLDYPVAADAFDTSGPDGGFSGDIMVTHLTEDGTDIIGSTFVGGDASDGINGITSSYGDSFRGEIIVDEDGNCFIASCTASDDFPVTSGALQETYGGGTQDAVIFSMNPALTEMRWSTYMGSTFNEGALGLRLDAEDNLFITGATTGEFMTMSGYQTTYQGGSRDGFVIRLVDDGTSIAASSYWGTTDADASFFVDLDSDGNVFLYGKSNGGSSEVTPDVYVNEGSNQFICKLSPSLADLQFGTVVGTSNFTPIAFMVDACGYIYFSGHQATSATYPLTADALYTTGGFYLGVLQPDAFDLEFATKYSGNHVDGGTSRFDPNNGIVYQAVCSCESFTTTTDAYSNTPGGGCDLGVFKIDFGISHVNAIASPAPAAAGCVPFTVDFENESSGLGYEWDFGDGSAITTDFEPSHTFTSPGVYNVRLVAFDPDGCLTSDTTYLEILVGSGETPTAAFEYDTDCATGAVTINYTGTDAIVEFNMGDGNNYDETEFTHIYTTDGTYTITLTAGDGFCADYSVVTEEIEIGSPTVEITYNEPNCTGFSDASLTVNIDDPSGLETIEITDTEDVLLNVAGSNTANSLTAGWYYYYVNLGDGCETNDSTQILDPEPLNAQINVTAPLCNGDLTGSALVDTVYNWQVPNYNEIVYIWAPDPDGISGTEANELTDLGAGEYTLTLNDGPCSRVFTFIVEEPTALAFSEFGTEPAYCRLFDYQTGNGVAFGAATGGIPDYHYEWKHEETGITTTNTTWGGLNPGTYTFTAEDENGCILSQSIVMDSLNPIAKFTASIDQIPTDCDATIPVEVTFTNQSEYFSIPYNPDSENDTLFHYNFGLDTSDWVFSYEYDEEFTIEYSETGTYDVYLVAFNKNGCTDSLKQTFKFCGELEFEIVNVFSPNEDGINDLFTFIDRSTAVKEFQCTVVNRWGVVIAEFNSITQSWDGRDKNGDYVTDGVYFYVYAGTGETGEAFSGQGNVQVVDSPK